MTGPTRHDDFPYEDPPETAPVLPDCPEDVVELPIRAGHAVANVKATFDKLSKAATWADVDAEFWNAIQTAERVSMAVARALDATTEEGSP